MKALKSVLGILAVCALTLSANAYDQKSLTIPNVTAGATSNGLARVIYVGNQNNLKLQWTSSATNVVVRIGDSVDGSRFTTNAWVITFDTSTTPGRSAVTNLNVEGSGYIRIDSVAVGGTINGTNTVSYGNKPGL